MAGTAGKKPKQGIETLLQTSQNLQQAKDQPLSTPLTQVAKGVTAQTTAAGQQAKTATTKVQEKTDTGTLNNTVQVNQAAYNTPPPAATAKTFGLTGGPAAAPSVANTVKTQLTPSNAGSGIEDFLGLPEVYQQATDASDAAMAKTEAELKGTLATDAAAIRTGKEKELQGIEAFLGQGTDLIRDAQGNIIGSNRGLGQVAGQGDLETLALEQSQALAAQDPTSNIDALASMLGVNYDPGLAGLASQVYQSDVAKARGEAAQATEAQKSAEAGRTGAMEQYLGSLKKGQENVTTARTKLGENVDKYIKDAESQIADLASEAGQKAGQDKQNARMAIINKGTALAGKTYNDALAAINKNGDYRTATKAVEDLRKMKAVLDKMGLPSTSIDGYIATIEDKATSGTTKISTQLSADTSALATLNRERDVMRSIGMPTKEHDYKIAELENLIMLNKQRTAKF